MEHLVYLPEAQEDWDAWAKWARESLASCRAPVLRDEEDRERPTSGRRGFALRALVAGWKSKGFKLSAEKFIHVASHAFKNASSMPPVVLRAVEQIAESCLSCGDTGTETLYYLSTVAWPLRDVNQELSQKCWDYMAAAPWQTDSRVWRELLAIAYERGYLTDERTALDLAEARVAAREPDAAIELLEAVALLEADVKVPRDLVAKHFANTSERIDGARRAVARLAHLYLNDDDYCEPYMRQVMQAAVDTEPSPNEHHQLREELDRRVWIPTAREAYAWAKKQPRHREFVEKVDRALTANQHNHARLLAEVVLAQRLDSVLIGDVRPNIDRAIRKFQRADQSLVVDDPQVRFAAQHFAVLCVRQNLANKPNREFVRRLVNLPEYVGPGAPLHPWKPELEAFVARDAVALKLAQEKLLDECRTTAQSDSEKRAFDGLQEWFDRRFHAASVEKSVESAMSRAADNEEAGSFADAVASSLRALWRNRAWFLGGTDQLRTLGEEIRARDGIGTELVDCAREHTRSEPWLGAAAGAAGALVPPNLSMLAVGAEFAVTLALLFRGLSKTSVLFGLDRKPDDQLAFFLDAIAVGATKDPGLGLVGFVPSQVHAGTASKLDGLDYSPARFGSYASARVFAPRVVERGILRVSRLLGLAISKRTLGKCTWVAGSIYCAWNAFEFLRDALEDATQIAVYRTLRHRLEEQHRETETR